MLQQPVDRLASLMLDLGSRMVDNGAQKGELNVALLWSDTSDLDLHVDCPCGTHIYYALPSCGKCSARLDVDMNRLEGDLSSSPVENVFWTSPPRGRCHVYVHNYRGRQGEGQGSPFKCIISTRHESRVFIDVVKPKEYKTVYIGDLFLPPPPPCTVADRSSIDGTMSDEWIPQSRYDLTVSSSYDPSMPPCVDVINMLD